MVRSQQIGSGKSKGPENQEGQYRRGSPTSLTQEEIQVPFESWMSLDSFLGDLTDVDSEEERLWTLFCDSGKSPIVLAGLGRLKASELSTVADDPPLLRVKVPLHHEQGFGEGLVVSLSQALCRNEGLNLGFELEAWEEREGALYLNEVGAPEDECYDFSEEGDLFHLRLL